MGRVTAYLRGFLNRLQGFLSKGVRTAYEIRAAAGSAPTFVDISEPEAEQMIQETSEAMIAAERWLDGGSVVSVNPPTLPAPKSEPLDGDDDNEYELGVVVMDPEDSAARMPVFGSIAEKTQVTDLIDRLEDYMDEHEGDDTAKFVGKIVESLRRSPRKALVPLWLYKVAHDDDR